MKLRAIFLIFVLCLFITVIGCNNKPELTSSGIVAESQDYSNSKKIEFYKNGLFNFNIVRPADMNDIQSGIVKDTIFKTARTYNQKRPQYLTDADDLNTGLSNIFIGQTNNPLSEEAYKKLTSRPNNYYDYVIMMKDGNIAINAISEEAFKNALNYFCNNLLVGLDATIPENYIRYYAPEDDSNFKINNIDITSYAIQCEEAPSGMVLRACEELQNAIKELSGAEIPIYTGKNHSYVNLISVFRDGEDPYAYSMGIEGNNFVIKGGHDYSLGAAVHKFAMNIKQLKIKDGKSVNVPSDYSVKGTYDKDTVGTDGYKLVFIDEFEGNGLNSDIWHYDTYENLENCRTNTDKNVKVENGIATVWSDKAMLSNGTMGYSGADIKGKNLRFAYGYYEIRCQVPKGTGSWPSFWAVGSSHTQYLYGAEIDVFEFFGSDNTPISQLHTWWTPGRKVRGLLASEASVGAGHIKHLNTGSPTIVDSFSGGSAYKKDGLSDGFHTYACEWTPAYIKFYCDGFCYTTVDLQSKLVDPNYGFRVTEFLAFCDGDPLSMCFGNGLTANTSFITPPGETTVYPSEYKIDYIALYQMDTLGTLTYNENEIERYGVFEDEK